MRLFYGTLLTAHSLERNSALINCRRFPACFSRFPNCQVCYTSLR